MMYGIFRKSYRHEQITSSRVSFIICISLLVLRVVSAPLPDDLQDLKDQIRSDLLNYPTDLTQEIVPKAIHSHNDYWRKYPVLTALSYGATSIEADVWLLNDTLFVGHELSALTTSRTLKSLYIDPLVKILDAMNPKTEIVSTQTYNGVFDTNSFQQVNLFIDVKTASQPTWDKVISELQPLRDRGYLTTYNQSTGVTRRPLVVIGTGGTPLDFVRQQEERDYFIDAPLGSLLQANSNSSIYSSDLSPVASASFIATVGWSGILPATSGQIKRIQEIIDEAHSLGIKTRFWDTPQWPSFAKKRIWRQLIEQGSDYLNCDDIRNCAAF